jgi:hypothetical protein
MFLFGSISQYFEGSWVLESVLLVLIPVPSFKQWHPDRLLSSAIACAFVGGGCMDGLVSI